MRPVLWRFCVGCSSAPHVFKQAFRLLSFFSVAARLTAAGFFSNPEHVASLTPALWETAEIGALWSDDFTRSALGTNWLILGGANVSITNNEVLFVEANTVYSRQLLHQPQQLCSDSWTIRWTQRFAALNSASAGVGVGIKNVQSQGGDDRGYNGLLGGAGTNLGKMQLERFNGTNQVFVAAGNAMTLAAGDMVDCMLSRSIWTITATASNRANGQLSTTSTTFPGGSSLITPPISQVCCYSLGGSLYLDDISFTINHRKPVRFIVIGASGSEGYNVTTVAHRYINVVQSNFVETICNDSSGYNTTSNSVRVLPEILAHQPGTALLLIGGNDLQFGFPATQWQSQYSNLVAQLQLHGTRVKHLLPSPRNVVDLRPLTNFIISHYPAADIIDTWSPLLTNAFSIKPIYNAGDGVHPNDAGHLLMGLIVRTNLN